MIQGKHIIGYKRVGSGRVFQAVNPVTGQSLPGFFAAGSATEVDEAVALATQSFPLMTKIQGKQRAVFLHAIVKQITLLGDELLERTAAESGLPATRIQGELARTILQIKLFADLIADGSWVEATIDWGEPNRSPMPKPTICRMLIPLGPVVIFGAGNFPLAFSVAGGDTISALAAGNPVIVKAHPGHPGTSELVGEAIFRAAQLTGMPEGIFSLLFDDGFSVGETLVTHPKIRAVSFTGSLTGGMALYHLATQRSEPIPVFAEMGSINPVILLPGALERRAAELASQCAGSVTLGAGQFCTCPGLLLTLKSPSLSHFIKCLRNVIESTPCATMLSSHTFTNYLQESKDMLAQGGVEPLTNPSQADTPGLNQGQPIIAQVSGLDFLLNPKLHQEVFGPFSLLVYCENQLELEAIIDQLNGQLTISVMAEPGEMDDLPGLQEKIIKKAGRLIFNGLPTGVEVCAAMQHGGPFPATTDSRFTSVGTDAIKRFVRPIAFQNWDDALLPDELKASNPLGIYRLVNQGWIK